MKVLKPMEDDGRIKRVASEPVPDWDPDEAERITDKIVAQYNGDIHAVIAPNDATAGAVIKVLKKYHIAGLVPVSGQDADADAVRRIMRGMQAMTVFKDTPHLASAAFGAAMNMAVGQPPPSNSQTYNGKMLVPSLLLEPIVVDKDNIVQTLIQTEYLTREQVYGDEDGTSAKKDDAYVY